MMQPARIEQTYQLTEAEFKLALALSKEETVDRVTIHSKPDGKHIEIHTVKGKLSTTEKNNDERGGYKPRQD